MRTTNQQVLTRLQQPRASQLGRDELRSIADELKVPAREVFRAAVELASSQFLAAQKPNAALTGAPTDVPHTGVTGNLGWAVTSYDFQTGPHPLMRFTLDVGDIERGAFAKQRPALLAQLEAYLTSAVPGARGTNAAAEVLMLEARSPGTFALSRPVREQARAFIADARAAYGGLDERRALASREVLAAKADALGVQFFEKGTYRQLKTPDISHRELSASTVTNPDIEAAVKLDGDVSTALARLHEAFVRVSDALESTT